MAGERFLTVGCNNILTFALGIPALMYVVYALSNTLWQGRGGMVGLSIIGVLY